MKDSGGHGSSSRGGPLKASTVRWIAAHQFGVNGLPHARPTLSPAEMKQKSWLSGASIKLIGGRYVSTYPNMQGASA